MAHFIFFFAHFYFPDAGQAVVTGVVPSSPRFLASIFMAHRVKQAHCSSIFHGVLLSHALALSASQLGHKKKSQRLCTSLHTAGLELTKLTYNRLEDNLIRHRDDRWHMRLDEPLFSSHAETYNLEDHAFMGGSLPCRQPAGCRGDLPERLSSGPARRRNLCGSNVRCTAGMPNGKGDK